MTLSVYQLPQPLFSLAEPLFTGAWFDRAQIGAVFEGRQHGSIYVDDPHHPAAALMVRSYGYYVAGDAGSQSLRQFMRDAPAEPGPFDDFYGYVPVGDDWYRAILEDHAGRLIDVGRRGFKHEAENPPDLGATRLPPNGSIVPIDRAMAERVDREMQQFIKLFWGSYEAYAEGGFGFCCLIDGQPASVAYTISVGWGEANIDVETARAYQRRGLSALTSRAYIEECLRRGLVATWDTDTVNIPSIAVARKLQLTEYPSFHQLSTPNYRKLKLSRGRWQQATEATGTPAGVTVWRRTE